MSAIKKLWLPILAPLDLLAQVSSRKLRAPWPEGERQLVETEDGWSLPLYRFAPAPDQEFRGPLLLQHGLAACHRVWTFPPRSIAAAFAAQGYEVWVSDLRGSLADRSPEGPRGRDWTIDDYLDHDLQSFVRHIRQANQGAPIFAYGHSMGGVLLMMSAIRHGSENYRGIVTSAASLDYTQGNSGFKKLLPLRPIVASLPWVPYGSFSKIASPILGRSRNKIEEFSYHPDNLEAELARQWFANVFTNIAPGVLLSLATTFEAGGFRSADGMRYGELLDRIQCPILMLGGSHDQQCPADAVQATWNRIPIPEKKLALFGQEHGHELPYGHADLLVGRSAPREVWPLVSEWLAGIS